MHRRVSFLFVVSILALACGTGSVRPAGIAAPSISAEVNGTVFYGSGTTAPANVDVTVVNHANVPITLRRVDISSPGMATHGLIPTFREVRETIAPGESKRVTVFATSVTTVRNPSEPLTIRAIADFESGKSRWREVVIR